jgi:hypothetical protein
MNRCPEKIQMDMNSKCEITATAAEWNNAKSSKIPYIFELDRSMPVSYQILTLGKTTEIL